jgi:hypothetical protein
MRNIGCVFFAVGLTILASGCKTDKVPEQAAKTAPAETSEPRIYVTDEVGGDLTVIPAITTFWLRFRWVSGRGAFTRAPIIRPSMLR